MKRRALLTALLAISACNVSGETTATQTNQPSGPETQIVAQWPSDVRAISDQSLAVQTMEMAKAWRLEDVIDAHAGNLYWVDGHDVGAGTINIFIYAPDAQVEAATQRLIALLDERKLPPGMRIGVAVYTDATRSDWTFRAAYPPGAQHFDLLIDQQERR